MSNIEVIKNAVNSIPANSKVIFKIGNNEYILKSIMTTVSNNDYSVVFNLDSEEKMKDDHKSTNNQHDEYYYPTKPITYVNIDDNENKQYDPCAHCNNNPKNNPNATGICCCTLPYEYRTISYT